MHESCHHEHAIWEIRVVKYPVDRRPRNSGSAVEHEGLGLVYAIHTETGCQSGGGTNKGTAIDPPDFRDAIDNPQGDCTDCNSPGFPDAYVEGPCGALDGSCRFTSQDCCTAAGGVIATEILACDTGRLADAGCCLPANDCTVTSQNCCAAIGGVLQDQRTCLAARACCLQPFGNCIPTFEPCCKAQGGLFFPAYTCSTLPKCISQFSPGPEPQGAHPVPGRVVGEIDQDGHASYLKGGGGPLQPAA